MEKQLYFHSVKLPLFFGNDIKSASLFIIKASTKIWRLKQEINVYYLITVMIFMILMKAYLIKMCKVKQYSNQTYTGKI